VSDWGFFGEMKYRFVGVAGSLFIRTLALFCAGELENRDAPESARADGRPVLYAFWHGRLMVPVYTHRGRDVGILISRSKDGEYIARVAERLGFHAIRGSSTRGGEEGFRLMVDYLRSGRDVAITPDGPTGPKYEVKKGVTYLARAAGAAIVPCGVAIDRYWQMGSWDEFRVMKPGAYILARFGEPIVVPEHSNKFQLEDVRVKLEETLNSLTADVESRVAEARRTKRKRKRYQGES
jgi:lysophospholipid acyltransferase (LPLAT)-like uncharacterized protein